MNEGLDLDGLKHRNLFGRDLQLLSFPELLIKFANDRVVIYREPKVLGGNWIELSCASGILDDQLFVISKEHGDVLWFIYFRLKGPKVVNEVDSVTLSSNIFCDVLKLVRQGVVRGKKTLVFLELLN